MDKITLELTVPEVNTTLQSLGQGPFVQVADLIGKIKTQAESQVNQPKNESVSDARQFLTE